MLISVKQCIEDAAFDGQRFIEEQVPGQGYELVTSYWHQASPEQKVLNLTRGMALGADFALQGARHYGPELVDLHYPLTDLDLEPFTITNDLDTETLELLEDLLERSLPQRALRARRNPD